MASPSEQKETKETKKRRNTALSDRRKREREMGEGKNLETQISKLADREEHLTEHLAPPGSITHLIEQMKRDKAERDNSLNSGVDITPRSESRQKSWEPRDGNDTPKIFIDEKNPVDGEEGADGGPNSAGDGDESRRPRFYPNWPAPGEVLGQPAGEGEGGGDPEQPRVFSSMVNKMVKLRRKASKASIAREDIFTSVILDMIRGKTPAVVSDAEKNPAKTEDEALPVTSAPIEVPSVDTEKKTPAPTTDTPQALDVSVPKSGEPKKRNRVAAAAAKMKLLMAFRPDSGVSALARSGVRLGPSLLEYLNEDFEFAEDDPHNWKRGMKRELTEGEKVRQKQQDETDVEEAKLADLRAKAKQKRLDKRAEEKAKQKTVQLEGEEGEEEGDEDDEDEDTESTISIDSYVEVGASFIPPQ